MGYPQTLIAYSQTLIDQSGYIFLIIDEKLSQKFDCTCLLSYFILKTKRNIKFERPDLFKRGVNLKNRSGYRNPVLVMFLVFDSVTK